MKKIYIIFCFAISSATISAQNETTKKADKLFNQYEYVSAAEEYLKLMDEKNPDNYIAKQLAASYYNMFNTMEASKWYAIVVKNPQDAETYYRYQQMLKANGNYEEANRQMQKFSSLSPNDQRAIAFKENPDYIPTLLKELKWYDLKIADFNSEKSDFGAIMNGKNIYFTSARNTARKKYGWNEEPYLDIYSAEYNSNGITSNIIPLADLNSKLHDGPVSITADGKTIYFTSSSFRESSFEKDKKNHIKLGRNNIFKATKEGDKWVNITSLPFNSSTYSTSNPSISKDGKTLYFSSDMPGTLGSTDIWKVTVNSDGSYGKPVNLGKNVNTEGKETFPFINDDNATLYFASSGRQGFGGLDVFQIDLTKNSAASNLGKPVNSEKDDFALTLNKEKNIGFISSNRTGIDKIYFATPVCSLQIITKVSDANTHQALINANVAIVDYNKNVIAKELTNDKGEVSYKVECNTEYAIQVSKDGFEGNNYAIAKDLSGVTAVNADLKPINEIITEKEVLLQPIFFEFNKNNITQNAAFELDKLVQVMTINPTMKILIKSHTDSKGSEDYNIALSDRRAKSTVQYLISKGISNERVSGKGYGESEPKIDCKDTCTPEQDASNRRSEFLIIK
jgi:outer membrane protein OmpA-like peptidoglycan-associated protein